MLWRELRGMESLSSLRVLGGFLSATLVRFAPGFDTDEL